MISTILEHLTRGAGRLSLLSKEQSITYFQLVETIESCRALLQKQAVGPGSVVALEGGFSLQTVAFLLSLWAEGAVAVLCTEQKEYMQISKAQWSISNKGELIRTTQQASHPLYRDLKGSPGLVLFSSGSAGACKAILHNVDFFLKKFLNKNPRYQRVVAYLLFDHLGGVDTLLYTLCNHGCLLIPKERNPTAVAEAIESYQAQILPTTPSFLRLLLLSEAPERYNLSSLEKIAYGSEPMPKSLLLQLHKRFPTVKFTQTYGLSEIGVLRSISESSDSLWMQIKGEEYQIRIVEGILQIKAPNAMIGYLNSADQSENGWFITGDRVEQAGEYIRVKGRVSDFINVGGQKVDPVEVEELIQQIEGVKDALVYGESSALLGEMVCAKIVGECRAEDIRRYLLLRVKKCSVPQKIVFVDALPLHERGKRIRRRSTLY